MASGGAASRPRTLHACQQCRARKQKCAGITAQITCEGCQNRKVHCSFKDESHDPRYNPYLRFQTPALSEGHVVGEASGSRSRSPAAVPSVPVPPPAAPGLNANQSSEIDSLRDRIKELEALQTRGTQTQSAWTSVPAHPPVVLPTVIVPDPAHHIPPLPPESTHQAPPPLASSHSSPSNGESRFNGPMRVLQDLGATDDGERENHDPISRRVLTQGEASLAFKIFFANCHSNAPFLDTLYDQDMAQCRSRNVSLFLAIVAVGCRFWSHESRRDTWLHPRYSSVVKLLDEEIFRLILRPRPADVCLETIQALMIYSHWMPIDGTATSSHHSRFSESSAWQSLGLATRWALYLDLDTIKLSREQAATDRASVRAYRTMLYLTESDHYLAMSARRRPTLGAGDLEHLDHFLATPWSQPTDHRLTSLSKVVQAAQVMGNHAETVECLAAFSADVDDVESEFLFGSVFRQDTGDKMSQHFPYTSLRWYRLTFASTLLPPVNRWSEGGKPLTQSIQWATQILYHLSSSTSMTPLFPVEQGLAHPLQPDLEVVSVLAFAIDQYFVVISYSAAFLVLAWQNGAIDYNLQTRSSADPAVEDRPLQSALYRLVNLASRTLRQSCPERGHLTTRYVKFLEGMADMVMAGMPRDAPVVLPSQAPVGGNAQPIDPENVGWDQEWLNLLSGSGLEQGWLFDSIGNAS